MARITVEDCLEHVENRFSLVLISAERTKQIMKGSQPLVDHAQGNKEIVTALREIGAGLIKYYEKDPEEIPPEIAAQEVKRVVQARQMALELQEQARPAPVYGTEPDDAEGDDDAADLDQLEDDFADDDFDE